MTHKTSLPPRADTLDPDIPYPKSWIDSLTQWIRCIPGPSWLFYVIAYLLFGLLNNAVRWMDGSLAAGTFIPIRVLDAGYLVFFLAFYEYLRGAAGHSFKTFRRILQAADIDLAQYKYQLTTLPRSLGGAAILAGLGLSLASLRANPESFGLDLLSKLPAILYLYLTVVFSFSCLFALLLQTVRQLRLVNHLHLRANEINLFQLGPAHAFSRLTARTGIGLIAFILYSALAESGDITELNLVALVLIGILAIVVFAVPLLGMRSRLEAEKNRMLEELNERIQLTLTRIHRQVDSNEHDNIGELKTAMSALIEERGIIRGISTWPWGGNTFRVCFNHSIADLSLVGDETAGEGVLTPPDGRGLRSSFPLRGALRARGSREGYGGSKFPLAPVAAAIIQQYTQYQCEKDGDLEYGRPCEHPRERRKQLV